MCWQWRLSCEAPRAFCSKSREAAMRERIGFLQPYQTPQTRTEAPNLVGGRPRGRSLPRSRCHPASTSPANSRDIHHSAASRSPAARLRPSFRWDGDSLERPREAGALLVRRSPPSLHRASPTTPLARSWPTAQGGGAECPSSPPQEFTADK